jgi:hypothetical protein
MFDVMPYPVTESAVFPKTDIHQQDCHVRKVPEAHLDGQAVLGYLFGSVIGGWSWHNPTWKFSSP